MTGLSCLVSLKESTASTKSGHAVTRHISTLSFGVTEFFLPSVPCHSPSVGVCTSPGCHSVTYGTLHRASKPTWYRLLLPASWWKFICSPSVTRCLNRVLSYFLSGELAVEEAIRKLRNISNKVEACTYFYLLVGSTLMYFCNKLINVDTMHQRQLTNYLLVLGHWHCISTN